MPSKPARIVPENRREEGTVMCCTVFNFVEESNRGKEQGMSCSWVVTSKQAIHIIIKTVRYNFNINPEMFSKMSFISSDFRGDIQTEPMKIVLPWLKMLSD